MDPVYAGTIEAGSVRIMKGLMQAKRYHLIDYDFMSQVVDGVLYITSYRLICPFYKRLYIRIVRDI